MAEAPLPIPGHLISPPSRLETYASLRFSVAETVEMRLIAADTLSALVKGQFSIQTSTRTSALLSCFGLKAYETASIDTRQSQPLHRLPSVDAMVACEQGAFAFKQPQVGQAWEAEEWPCLLYQVRYRFSIDPVSCIHIGSAGNHEAASTTCYYYRRGDAQELTMGELMKMGIAINDGISS